MKTCLRCETEKPDEEFLAGPRHRQAAEGVLPSVLPRHSRKLGILDEICSPWGATMDKRALTLTPAVGPE